MTTSAESTVRAFVAAVNAHDPPGIVALCTDDHVFTDSLGSQMSGEALLEAGWAAYFSWFPDYRIDIEVQAGAGDLILACGFASATHAASGVSWRIPAAWRAKVVAGRISEWQVYADNKPVYALLSGNT